MEEETKKLKEKEKALEEKYENIDSRIKQLNNQIEPIKKEIFGLEEERDKIHEEQEEIHKKLILNTSGLTEDQVYEIANNLSKSNEVMIFYNNEIGENDECEDDGAIHVTRRGIRFCKKGSESQLKSFANNVEKQIKRKLGDKNG